MTRKCASCGRENVDSALQCVCGSDLQQPAPSELQDAVAPASEPQRPPSLVARRPLAARIGFGVGALALVPLFAAFRAHLHVAPLARSLIGTGLFVGLLAAGLWRLGRDDRRARRAWRLFFLLWAVFVTPLLLAITDGLAEQGWPSGRPNRTIARILVMLLTLTVPAYLTGVSALVRLPRLTGALASVTGLVSIGCGYLLYSALAPFRGMTLRLVDILNIVMFWAKALGYAAIPVGVALVVGGIMTIRSRPAGMPGTPVAPRPEP